MNLPLYEQLQDRSQPIYLNLNDMMYKFDSTREAASALAINEPSDWFNVCKKNGLSNMHASTIATILR